MDNTSLAKLELADRMLAEATDLHDIAEIRDIATAARAYAKAAQLGIDATNKAALIKVKAERKAGEYLAQLDRNQGGDRHSSTFHHGTLKSDYAQTLEDVQIPKVTAHRWQKMAEVPQPVFEQHVKQVIEAQDELTSAGILRLAASDDAQMRSSSGRNLDALMSSKSDEWYTTPDIIEAVNKVMGGIDLDPCSNDRDNPNVPAGAYYTKEDDGLSKQWHGRVYVNPPYGNQIPFWVNKINEEYRAGNINQCILLLPARPDTRWFRALKEYPRCFMHGRVTFNDHDNSAPFPTMLVGIGVDLHKFIEVMEGLGDVYQWVTNSKNN
jgi:phage N-6-adenine-methyltransferase